MLSFRMELQALWGSASFSLHGLEAFNLLTLFETGELLFLNCFFVLNILQWELGISSWDPFCLRNMVPLLATQLYDYHLTRQCSNCHLAVAFDVVSNCPTGTCIKHEKLCANSYLTF